jgi:FMN phosphatase YigB (HAD superfamily)
MQPRVVCFDIGGVLVRIVKSWDEAVAAAGLSNSKNPAGPFHHFHALDPYQKGDLELDAYLGHLAEHLCLETGDDALAVHNGILVEEYPGVLSLILRLKRHGIFTACLSNTNAPHFATLTGSGRFPAIEALDLQLASHNLALNKPDVAIYEAFERLARAEPGEIVFFDDSSANVAAAIDRGWWAFPIDPDADPAGQMSLALTQIGLLG